MLSLLQPSWAACLKLPLLLPCCLLSPSSKATGVWPCSLHAAPTSCSLDLLCGEIVRANPRCLLCGDLAGSALWLCPPLSLCTLTLQLAWLHLAVCPAVWLCHYSLALSLCLVAWPHCVGFSFVALRYGLAQVVLALLPFPYSVALCFCL